MHDTCHHIHTFHFVLWISFQLILFPHILFYSMSCRSIFETGYRIKKNAFTKQDAGVHSFPLKLETTRKQATRHWYSYNYTSRHLLLFAILSVLSVAFLESGENHATYGSKHLPSSNDVSWLPFPSWFQGSQSTNPAFFQSGQNFNLNGLYPFEAVKMVHFSTGDVIARLKKLIVENEQQFTAYGTSETVNDQEQQSSSVDGDNEALNLEPHNPVIIYPMDDFAMENADEAITRNPPPKQRLKVKQVEDLKQVRDILTEPVFRIIVLTFNRPKSLERLLNSLEKAFYQDDKIALYIYIDCPKQVDDFPSEVDYIVWRVSLGAQWTHGPKVVIPRKKNAGLLTQWIDTWAPESVEEGLAQRAVILEDDLEVSPFYYTWLKGAYEKYGHREDVIGFTLQRGTLRARRTANLTHTMRVSSKYPLYLYKLVGSWGYSPNPKQWMEFREWYHRYHVLEDFHPYVNDLIVTEWYKKQEQNQTMWTMWFVYYCDKYTKYTVYGNMPNRKTLAANWQERGLHFISIAKKDFDILKAPDLNETGFIYPDNPIMLDWDGSIVNYASLID